LLPQAQVCEQHDLAIRELNGIVMRAWIVQVDLPKPPNPMRNLTRFLLEETQEKSRLLSPDIAVECDLGAREKTDGHFRLSDRGESLCRGVPELRRNQPVSDLGRS